MSKKSLLDIKDILNEYSTELQEDIASTAQEVAQLAASDLKATQGTYQVRTGKYNKGWTVNTKKGKENISCVVHNAKNWRLTHLLENGHINRDGKTRTRAFVHIKPVETKYVNEYTKDVEKIIKNGG